MISLLRHSLDDEEHKLASLESELSVNREQNAKVASIYARELEIKEARGEINKSTKTVTRESEECEDQLDAINLELNSIRTELVRVKERQDQLAAERKESEDSEMQDNGVIKLAKIERRQLAEEKLKLVKIIEDATSSHKSTSEQEIEKELLDLESALNSTLSEKALAESDYSAAADKCKETRDQIDDLTVSITKEIQSLEKFICYHEFSFIS